MEVSFYQGQCNKHPTGKFQVSTISVMINLDICFQMAINLTFKFPWIFSLITFPIKSEGCLFQCPTGIFFNGNFRNSHGNINLDEHSISSEEFSQYVPF